MSEKNAINKGNDDFLAWAQLHPLFDEKRLVKKANFVFLDGEEWPKRG